jgi:hypothetical protein
MNTLVSALEQGNAAQDTAAHRPCKIAMAGAIGGD